MTASGAHSVFTLLVEVGRAPGDGLPDGCDGAAMLCYTAASAERQAVDETVDVLRQAGLSPLEVQVHGTLAEREAAGHEIGEDDRSLMQRALDENAVIVAQVIPFEDDGSEDDPHDNPDDAQIVRTDP
ncbi:MAG: hypothetical protein ACFBSD_08705 [Paracoccaceae bacterium]